MARSNITGPRYSAYGFGLPSFEVDDLPDADDYEGVLVHCSNGAGGDPCLAYSDGSDWLRILIGTEVHNPEMPSGPL